MKRSGKFLKQAVEYMTQYVLLPGVELNLDDVVYYYKTNLDIFGVKVKFRSSRRSSTTHEW